jgi:hypothetical protein
MGWADRRSKNGIVDGIAKNQNKIKGEEHMNYQEFIDFVPAKCMYETIYTDSEGRLILVIDMLSAYDMVNKAKRTWVGLTDEEIKAFDTWHDNREEEVGWCNPSEIVAYIEAKLKEKNT